MNDQKRRRGKLIIASSEEDVDILYRTHFFVPDPCIFLEWQGKKILVLSKLEYGRGKKEAQVDQVMLLEEILKEVRIGKSSARHLGHAALALLKKKRCKQILVSPRFPYFYAAFLRKRGIRVEVALERIYPSRQRKSPEELKNLRQIAALAEGALLHAIGILKKSKIKDNAITFEGKRLTSERLREEMALYCLKSNALALHSIVASGKQSADPHQIGKGVLRPHQPIILDIFPRHLRHNYFADITRTVVKGNLTPQLQKMIHAVIAAQQAGLAIIRAGTHAKKVHQKVFETLTQNGFKTESRNGTPVGFIHSTGHGIGLEVHEPPRIGNNKAILKENMVVTIEPGLYYPECGGVRVEDMIVVKKKGAEPMTKLRKYIRIE